MVAKQAGAVDLLTGGQPYMVTELMGAVGYYRTLTATAKLLFQGASLQRQ